MTTPSATIDRIREAVDIVALIQQYTPLRVIGSRWVGLCPFHKEKDGSFSVDASKGLWHCFGCGLGGDAFSFLQRIESLRFPQALRVLANYSNIPIDSTGPTPKPVDREERKDAEWWWWRCRRFLVRELKRIYWLDREACKRCLHDPGPPDTVWIAFRMAAEAAPVIEETMARMDAATMSQKLEALRSLSLALRRKIRSWRKDDQELSEKVAVRCVLHLEKAERKESA